MLWKLWILLYSSKECWYFDFSGQLSGLELHCQLWCGSSKLSTISLPSAQLLGSCPTCVIQASTWRQTADTQPWGLAFSFPGVPPSLSNGWAYSKLSISSLRRKEGRFSFRVLSVLHSTHCTTPFSPGANQFQNLPVCVKFDYLHTAVFCPEFIIIICRRLSPTAAYRTANRSRTHTTYFSLILDYPSQSCGSQVQKGLYQAGCPQFTWHQPYNQGTKELRNYPKTCQDGLRLTGLLPWRLQHSSLSPHDISPSRASLHAD